MKIYVKYFASVRDIMGKGSEDLKVEASLSANELWESLTVDKKTPVRILIAVNHEYVNKNFKLKDGDEIAFFPPVTGG
ncbi:molybdopterin converting factor subunit 1 [Gammaproteobacteria bacterium]|nr:molybdopterin converting factor subunit 1 [Gammaproteobacteria bacterium]